MEDFLQDYEQITDSCGLTNEQKVEKIVLLATGSNSVVQLKTCISAVHPSATPNKSSTTLSSQNHFLC